MGNTKSLDSAQTSGKQLKWFLIHLSMKNPLVDWLLLKLNLCVTEGGAVIQQSRKLPGSQKYALLKDRLAKSEGKEILNVAIRYIIGDQLST